MAKKTERKKVPIVKTLTRGCRGGKYSGNDGCKRGSNTKGTQTRNRSYHLVGKEGSRYSTDGTQERTTQVERELSLDVGVSQVFVNDVLD
jgi:hypothetical protein